MATVRDVFARKELKYRISRRRKDVLLAVLDGRIEPDEFGLTRITSLYYDTPERLLALRSYDKPFYKEKLRLRLYGDPSDGERVFVEVKKKLDGIVYKRRVGMSRAAARAYLTGMPYERACRRFPLDDAAANAASLSPRSRQIAREIDAFKMRYGALEPTIEVTCSRKSFAERTSAATGRASSVQRAAEASAAGQTSALRLTFDEDLAWRDASRPGFEPRRLLYPGEVVMEVKTAGALPLWFVHALDEVSARPVSYSKYGEAFHDLVEGEKGCDRCSIPC